MTSTSRSQLLFGLVCLALSACSDPPSDPVDARTDTTDDAVQDVEADSTDIADPDIAESDADNTPDSGEVGQDAGSEDADDASETDTDDPDCPQWWTVHDPTPDGPGAGTTGRSTDEYTDGASAGRVTSGVGNFEGIYAACRTGDWVLENEVLRACIADERSMSQMLFDGGNLVDIELRDSPGNDELYYAVTASGLLNQAADRVELVADGSDGGAAVIRVSGPDALMMFIAATIGSISPSVDVDMVTEYRLEPGATALSITTWMTKADGRRTVVRMGDLIAGGDTTQAWAPGAGFNIPGASTQVPFVASIGETHSVGVTSPNLTLQSLTLPEIEIPFGSVTSAIGLLCPGETASFRRWLTVGGGDTWSLREGLSEHLPEDERLSILFDGWPGHYEIHDSEGASVDVVRFETQIEWNLPAGDYTATPLNWPTEEPPVTAFSASAGAQVTLPLPQLGTVSVAVTDESGDAIAAEVRFSGPVDERLYALSAGSSIVLPPGNYDVWAWRGLEYSAWQGTVEVLLDGEVSVAPVLTHEVDMRNWVGGDMHQHATPSPDSGVSLLDRVRSNLGAGVDFISPSDHDALGDFAGAIAALGVEEELHLLLGEELSPGLGHINLFPRTFDRQAAFSGALPLGERVADSRELILPPSGVYIEAARADGVTFVQLNHPRGSLAHFSATRYDPVLGPDANDNANWFDDFDAIEVYNTPGTFCVGLQDWFSLLSHGRVTAGMGNSDTHDLDPPAGWPRNYVRSTTDNPGELSDSAILDELLALRATVSGGIFVEFSGGLYPGDTLEVDAGIVTIPLRVRAPSWADIDEVRLYANGVAVDAIEIDRERGAPYDESLDFRFEFDSDAYIVAIAYSNTPLDVVAPGKRPFGFTNPVFIDVGRDGWTPPGVADASALPMPANLPNCD